MAHLITYYYLTETLAVRQPDIIVDEEEELRFLTPAVMHEHDSYLKSLEIDAAAAAELFLAGSALRVCYLPDKTILYDVYFHETVIPFTKRNLGHRYPKIEGYTYEELYGY